MLSLLLLISLLNLSVSDSERDAVFIETETIIVKTDPLEELRFTRQPEDLQVEENDPLELHCTVKTVAGAGYLYRWYKFPDLRNVARNDGSRISGAAGPTLRISAAQSHHMGQYMCDVTVEGTNYTIVSNTGYLQVNYYKGSNIQPPVQNFYVQEGIDYMSLICGLSDSFPEVEATWYKDNKPIPDQARIFVLPRQAGLGYKMIEAGSLVIMYVEREDKGLYECRTTYKDREYRLNRYNVIIDGLIQTSDTIAVSDIVHFSGESTYGGEAVLYCTGIGKPAPYITWSKSDGSRIETSEKFILQDHRRRMVITNVDKKDGTSYTCSVQSRGTIKRAQVVTLKIVPPSDSRISFISQPISQIIYTNKYPPFILKCSIDLTEFIGVEGRMMPVLYWLKDGEQLGFSKRRRSSTRQDAEQNILESSIEFASPNESDQGVYQCVGRGTLQLRQTTAYVNIRKMESDYDLDLVEPYYDVVKVAMTVAEAEEHCQTWRTNGHLVSIMSSREAEKVTQLLRDEAVKEAWIGLTCEWKAGEWQWTQPADNSEKFSYWANEMPDNLYGHECYAVMDTELNGRWRDIRKNGNKYPFVCKQYSKTCKSVREYFENKLEPINKVETTTTEYGVGESITVTCTDRRVALKETLTCTTSGRYEPDDGFACPIYNAATLTNSLSITTLTILSVLQLLLV